MSIRLAAPVALFLLGACGFKQSNAVDLPPKDGIPVKIVEVRMRETLHVGLGSKPTQLSSGMEPNTRGVTFIAELTGEAEPYAGVTGQIVCKLGEHVVAGMFAFNANRDLENAAIGTRVEGSTSFEPSSFVEEIPSTCEARIYYTIAPPMAAVPGGQYKDHTRAELIGTVCFVDDTLHPRACTEAELPRTPAASELELGDLHAYVGTLDDGRFGLGVDVLVTFGETPLERASLKPVATCTVGDTETIIPLPMMFAIDRVLPGESTVTHAFSMPGDAMSTAPSSCDIELTVRADGDAWRELGRHCLRGDKVEAGGC